MTGNKRDAYGDAFYFYTAILQKKSKKIEPTDRELFGLYRNPEVREILEDIIEPTARVKFVQLDPTQSIYIIPNFDNEVHRYTNEELRVLWGVKSNAELYIVQFAFLVLISLFYNRDNLTLTERSSVSLPEWNRTLTSYIQRLKGMSTDELDSYSEEMDLDLNRIAEEWDNKMLVVETAKKPDKAPTGKFGMLNRVLAFQQQEELISLVGDEIRLTAKMNTLILRYYFNESRKNQLFEFLLSPIFKGREVTNGNHS